MKPIKARPTIIDIPFVDENDNELFTLHFDRSDKNVNSFYDKMSGMEKTIKVLEENPEAEVDEKEFIKKIADSFLGEGAFEKIYSINNSTFSTAKYLFQIAVGIKEEFEEEDKKAVFDKYK
jgi:hypothetical protein